MIGVLTARQFRRLGKEAYDHDETRAGPPRRSGGTRISCAASSGGSNRTAIPRTSADSPVTGCASSCCTSWTKRSAGTRTRSCRRRAGPYLATPSAAKLLQLYWLLRELRRVGPEKAQEVLDDLGPKGLAELFVARGLWFQVLAHEQERAERAGVLL